VDEIGYRGEYGLASWWRWVGIDEEMNWHLPGCGWSSWTIGLIIPLVLVSILGFDGLVRI
jgi:hypothetical protein